MGQITIKLVMVVVLIVLAQGCVTTDSVDKNKLATQCPSERPQMCTREYMPVCGVLSSGEQKTYGNGCSACADQDVVGFNPGACP